MKRDIIEQLKGSDDSFVFDKRADKAGTLWSFLTNWKNLRVLWIFCFT